MQSCSLIKWNKQEQCYETILIANQCFKAKLFYNVKNKSSKIQSYLRVLVSNELRQMLLTRFIKNAKPRLRES